MEKVEASILGTIYRNDDNGYTVLTAREGRREITVVGTLPELHPGCDCCRVISLGSGRSVIVYFAKRFLFMKNSSRAQAETAMMVTATKMSSPVEGLEGSRVTVLSL